jgi:hypothetical protein
MDEVNILDELDAGVTRKITEVFGIGKHTLSNDEQNIGTDI